MNPADARLAGRPFRLSGQSRHRAPDRHPSGGLHGRGSARRAREGRGGHTKNLFLRDKKGTAFLVVAQEDAAIELKSLHRAPRRLGAVLVRLGGTHARTRSASSPVRSPRSPSSTTRPPGDGRSRCRADGARRAPFSPAVEHRDDDDLARGADRVSRSDRAQAANRAARRRARLKPRLHSAGFFPSNQADSLSIEGDQGRLRPAPAER